MKRVFRVFLVLLLPSCILYQKSMRELDRLNLFDPPI